MAAAMGRAIQVVRTDRGWSRKDFAERTGLSYSFLSEIENGVKEPSSRTFALISETLDVAPGALLYDAERRLSEDTDNSQREISPSRAPGEESAPTIQRSRRVLDWIAGPLARRSSEDSGPAFASIRRVSSEYVGDQTRMRNHEAQLESPERANFGVSVDEFLGSLLPILSELSPEDRELVLDLARRLARSDAD